MGSAVGEPLPEPAVSTWTPVPEESDRPTHCRHRERRRSSAIGKLGNGLRHRLLLFVSRRPCPLFSVRVLGTEPRTGSEINLALSLLLLALVCFYSLGPGSRTLGSILGLSSIRWVLVFLAFSLCSLAWSETVSLSTSIAYWCGMAAEVAMVVLLLHTGSVTRSLSFPDEGLHLQHLLPGADCLDTARSAGSPLGR